MLKPSRTMPAVPPAPPGRPVLGALVCSVLIACAFWLCGWQLLIGLAGSVLIHLPNALVYRHWTRVRSEESICDFARSFARRSVDPWVIRATYEHFREICGYSVRADDHFEEPNGLPDILDLEAFEAREIAMRVGRRYDTLESNPWFCRVDTVGDLVHFLSHQPLLVESPDRWRPAEPRRT